MEITFAISIFVYLVVSRKLDYWLTLRILGLPSQCPAFVVNSEFSVHLLSWLSFLIVLAIGIVSPFPWWIAVGVLAAAWFIAGKLGHTAAYNRYRKFMKEMIEVAGTEDEKEQCLIEANRSNMEMHDLLLKRTKY